MTYGDMIVIAGGMMLCVIVIALLSAIEDCEESNDE